MLHIIASALTRSILDRKDANEQRRYYSGCATGFRDTSRIASSSPTMWKEICLANTAAIIPALDHPLAGHIIGGNLQLRLHVGFLLRTCHQER